MNEHDAELYKTYVFLCERKFPIQKKCSLMTALVAGETWAWPVIGITEKALEALEKNDYRYVKGVVCRAHLVDRINTARAIFDNPECPMQEDEFFRRISQDDATVIATKSENKTGGTVSRYIPIDKTRELFQSKFIAWKHGPAEREYLRGLHAAYKNGAVDPVSA